jgi:hypothetical protein
MGGARHGNKERIMQSTRLASLAAVFALSLLAVPLASQAQEADYDGVVANAPPPIPDAAQPPSPGDGYMWTPGYWAFDPANGYYWVAGNWVMPPAVGVYWTPGYWGWGGRGYFWHAGYWGPNIGYYGGINYGCGYFGTGFVGGVWNRGVWNVNAAYNNIDPARVPHFYNQGGYAQGYGRYQGNSGGYNHGWGGGSAAPHPTQPGPAPSPYRPNPAGYAHPTVTGPAPATSRWSAPATARPAVAGPVPAAARWAAPQAHGAGFQRAAFSPPRPPAQHVASARGEAHRASGGSRRG